MNFSTNYDDLGSSLLPEGKYECIVKDAFPSETKKGTPYLDIRLVIRNIKINISSIRYGRKKSRPSRTSRWTVTALSSL